MKTNNVHVERVQASATNRRWVDYLVKVDGQVVGMLVKGKDTRTTKHPWRAFVGVGAEQRFIGAFYQGGCPVGALTGGKIAALNAILEAAK